ncbi:MAG: AAA family ATPase [Candidatus Methanomethylophilaceae archaeon]
MKKVDTCGLPFRDLRVEGWYYVDKTLLIKDILDSGSKVYLFTRPRRFGKTTNLSMLDFFFNIRYRGNDWFDGLRISEHHEFDVMRNTHPVINLNLASTSTTCYDYFLSSLVSCILISLKEHPYLIDSPVLNDDDRRFIDHVMSKRMTREEVINSLSTFSDILERHHGRKVVVLIDEYDSAVSGHLGSDSHGDVMRLMEEFMIASFGDNDSLLFACIMGIIPLGEMFVGVDDIRISDVFSHGSDDGFGFTVSEVRDILMDQGRPELLPEVMEWYGRYRFGDVNVCNPFAVMCYVGRGMKPYPYWSESGSSVIPGITTNGEDILVGVDADRYIVDLPRDIRYSKTGDREHILAMMVMTGYLSATAYGDGVYGFSIPNRDVETILPQGHREQKQI